MTTEAHKFTHADWISEAKRRFGEDVSSWRFVCPSCGHEAAVRDWKAANAPEGAVAFSCVGRWLAQASDAFSGEPGPCNYAGAGLIAINPVRVLHEGKTRRVFAFADQKSTDVANAKTDERR